MLLICIASIWTCNNKNKITQVIIIVRRSSRAEAVKLSNRVQMNNCKYPSTNCVKKTVVGGKESPDKDSSAPALLNHETICGQSTDDVQQKQSHNSVQISSLMQSQSLSPSNPVGQRTTRSMSTTPNSTNGIQNHKAASAATAPQTTKARKSSGGGGATTVALLCISFYYIVTTVPLSVFEILVVVVKNGSTDIPLSHVAQDPQWQAYFLMHTARLLVVDFALSHYAIFLYIYLLTSPAFRNVTIKVLARYLPCIFGPLHRRIVRNEQLAMLKTFA